MRASVRQNCSIGPATTSNKSTSMLTHLLAAVSPLQVFNSTVTKLKDENSFEVYVGLTSMVKKVCVPGTGCFDYELELVEWWKSTEMGQSEDGVELCEDALAHDVGVFCGNCRNVAVNNIPAAFFSCATLCFALYGCINRMKFISDCPVQKILGCITDTWGTISLASMLIEFNVNCVWTLPAHTQGYTLEYIRGPGFYMYTFCMLTALVRAVLHWLTPLPSQGVGCHMVIPSKDETVTALTALRKWEESARKRLQLQIVQGALVTKAVAATGAASGAAILRRSVDLASSELSHKCPRASAAASGGASAVMSTTRWSLNEVSARANALKRTSSGDGVADVTSEVPNPAAGWSAGELTNHLLQKIGKDNAITAKEAVDQLAISAPSNLQHLISATVSDIPEEEDVTMLSTWSPSSGLALAVLSQNMPRKKAGLNGVDLTPDFSETGDAQGDEESGKVVMTQPSSSSSSSSSSNSCPSSPLYRTSEGVARFDGDVEAMNKAMIPEHPSGVSETKHDASPSRAAEAEANSSSSASHMKEYYETPSKEEST